MEKQEGRRAAETVPPSGGSGLRSSHVPKGTFPRETSEQLQVCLSGKGGGGGGGSHDRGRWQV